MSSGRIEGLIRWSNTDPDSAIISHSTGDYHADFMDLNCLHRPSNGDQVVFTPQLLHGILQARTIELKSSEGSKQPRTEFRAKSPRPKANKTNSKAGPKKLRCRKCLSIVSPRMKPVGHHQFEKYCPKCNTSLDNTQPQLGKLILVSTLVIGVSLFIALSVLQ